jgi:predicted dehydrogenase
MAKGDRLRAAVVGAGHMGQYHTRVYAELWDIDLVAVVDSDLARARAVAGQYETLAVGDHHELMGRADVVSVCVPTGAHFAVARDLLSAGISVLIEKPITPTLDEARELFAIARSARAILHVGHVERFNGAVQELRKIIDQPILIESRRLGPFTPRVQTDSVVMDLMIHDIDIVLGLVEAEPQRLAAAGVSVHSELTDVVNAQIEFASGTIANITASRATEQKIRTLAITQPEAYIVLDYTDQDIQIHRRAAHDYTLNRDSIRYRQGSFVEHVFVHKENPLKLEVLNLLQAVRESRQTGRVELSETDDLRSFAVALEIERMIRDGQGEVVWAQDLPWSARSA